MKIFVISLNSSLERRKKIIMQMTEHSLDFTFFDAINGATEHPPILNDYSNEKRLAKKGYSLNPGELGCFASHYSLWQKCFLLNEPIVILEDDIHFNEHLNTILVCIEKYIHQLGLVRLSRTLKPSFIKLFSMPNESMMVKYTKPAKGGMGYVLSPKAAKKLINKTKDWHDPADDFLEKEWLHNVKIFGVEPPCLTHDFEVDSEIGERKKCVQPVLKRVQRELYRSSEWLLNQAVSLPFNAKIKLGLFKIEKNT